MEYFEFVLISDLLRYVLKPLLGFGKIKVGSKFFKFVMNSMLGIIQLKLENQSNEKSANCDKF